MTMAEKEKNKTGRKRYFRGLLSGNLFRIPEVRRNLPYAFFIALLMFLYITIGYYTQKIHRKYDRLSKEVNELRIRSLSLNEKRMTSSRQSAVIQTLKVNGVDLQESVSPPKVVE